MACCRNHMLSSFGTCRLERCKIFNDLFMYKTEMEAVRSKTSSSTSDGVQCELGCEAYRHCKPFGKEDSLVPGYMSRNPVSRHPSYSVNQYRSAEKEPPGLRCSIVKSEDSAFVISETSWSDGSSKIGNEVCGSVSFVHEGFICGFCGSQLNSHIELEVHCAKNHGGIIPLKCHKCGKRHKTWLGPAGLKAHLKFHPPVCVKSGSPSSLVVNREQSPVQGNVGEEPYFEENQAQPSVDGIDFCELVCGDCGLRFVTPLKYETHCKSHHLVDPFRCVECDLRFSKRVNLDEHRASHLLVKPYVCQDCGTLFSFLWSFLQHSKTHGNTANFVCKFCDEEFLLEKYLAAHEKSHTENCCENVMESKGVKHCEVSEYLLKCNVCNFPFESEEELSCHMEAHQHPQRFMCEECDVVCSSFLAMREHVTVAHEDLEVHWCADCGGSGSVLPSCWAGVEPDAEIEATSEDLKPEVNIEENELILYTGNCKGMVEEKRHFVYEEKIELQRKKIQLSRSQKGLGRLGEENQLDDGNVKNEDLVSLQFKRQRTKIGKRKEKALGPGEPPQTWKVRMEVRQEKLINTSKQEYPVKTHKVVSQQSKRKHVKKTK